MRNHFFDFLRVYRVSSLVVAFLLCSSLVNGQDYENEKAMVLRSVDLKTGITLNYAEQGRGSNNLLIFLHGYLDSWFSYSAVLESLPKNYHAIAITMRGHGDSDKPLQGYEMEDFSDDIIAFMDHFGYRRASFVGHSMGSLIAERLAIDHPDRVKKLILIGASASAVGNTLLTEVLDAVTELQDPIPYEFVYEFQAETAPNPISSAFINGIVSETEKIPARIWRDALEGLLHADYTEEVSKIQAPTLLIWGGGDAIFSAGEQQDLLDRIPNSQIVVYPNLSHSLNWEQPRLVALEIDLFMRTQASSCAYDLVP